MVTSYQIKYINEEIEIIYYKTQVEILELKSTTNEIKKFP